MNWVCTFDKGLIGWELRCFPQPASNNGLRLVVLEFGLLPSIVLFPNEEGSGLSDRTCPLFVSISWCRDSVCGLLLPLCTYSFDEEFNPDSIFCSYSYSYSCPSELPNQMLVSVSFLKVSSHSLLPLLILCSLYVTCLFSTWLIILYLYWSWRSLKILKFILYYIEKFIQHLKIK